MPVKSALCYQDYQLTSHIFEFAKFAETILHQEISSQVVRLNLPKKSHHICR